MLSPALAWLKVSVARGTIASVVWLLGVSLAVSEETVSMQGSTVVNSRLIEPFRSAIEAASGYRLTVIPNKSIHGLLAVLEGRTSIAMISSSLESERDMIHQKWPQLPVERLQSFDVARTRVAFVVHPANPVAHLDVDAIARILRGEIRNWREVGGEDLDIVVVSTQSGGGVPTTVRHELLARRPMTPARLIEIEMSRQVVKVVAQERGAFGITQAGLAKQAPVNELRTDRPVEQQMNLVTLGSPSPAAQAVINAIRVVAIDDPSRERQ